MIVDKKGKLFENRRKVNKSVKTDRRTEEQQVKKGAKKK